MLTKIKAWIQDAPVSFILVYILQFIIISLVATAILSVIGLRYITEVLDRRQTSKKEKKRGIVLEDGNFF